MMFYNPYLKCAQCGAWCVGRTDAVGSTFAPLDPCGHKAGAQSVCPSWGPVDGCSCPPAKAAEHGRPELTDRQRMGVLGHEVML